MFRGKKVLAFVAEFNPFHEGHRYFIDQAKKRFGGDYVVAVMSGDFVQRGEPAIFSKYRRAREALSNGVDLVLMLPVFFSTSSAEFFAEGSVAILTATGFADMLVFGSECGDMARLSAAADYLLCGDGMTDTDTNNEASRFVFDLREGLRQGKSFPAARFAAMDRSLFPFHFGPNDVLGIEYLKSLRRMHSGMEAVLVPRKKDFASAHEIRDRIKEGGVQAAESKGGRAVFPDSLSAMLGYRLLELKKQGIPPEEFQDISGDLGRVIMREAGEPLGFSERVLRAKSRNWTYSRICRAFLHILLDIRKEDMEKLVGGIREGGNPPWLRVLGVSGRGRELLGALKVPPALPLSKWAARHVAGNDRVFETDIFASHIYRMLSGEGGSDYTEKLLICP